MQRLNTIGRLLVAIVMLLGLMALTNSSALAGETAPTEEPTEAPTEVPTQDVDDGEATEAPVDVLPDTGNGPESGDGQPLLLVSAAAALILLAAAAIVRRARLN
jgi:hypothetical protein